MKNIAQTQKGKIEYRLEGTRGGPTMLVLNGGHTHCDSFIPHLKLFLDQGYQVLIPSRPGYGQTPAATGKTAAEAADAMIALLDQLGIEKTLLMAISAAGRTALQLAGRHPERIDKLILQCSLAHDDWPDPQTKVLAYLIFNPLVEGPFWAFFRLCSRLFPVGALKAMMGNLTTLNANEVVDNMTEEQQKSALEFLRTSRSGSGFLHDIKHRSGDLNRITAPTLIIHSRFDGSNDFSHAEYAAQHIQQAELFATPAESHLMWFGPHNTGIEIKIIEFLSGQATVASLNKEPSK